MEKTNFQILKKKKSSDPCAVSVIIPVYNAEKYVGECLDSVLAQTLSQIEIICVNDGSDDGSLEILLKYAQNEDRITVITQENAGVSAARNAGIRQAEGEYLYFLDSDDTVKAETLQTLYSRAKQNQLELLLCDGISFAEPGECTEAAEKFNNYYTRKSEYPELTTGPQLMAQMHNNNEYRVSCAMQFVQREFFFRNQLWFEEGILHEDNLYTFRGILSAKRVGYVHQALYHRRVHENSIMTKKKSFDHAYGYFVAYRKMMDFYRTLQLSLEEQEAASEILFRLLQSGRFCYSELEEEERKKTEQMDPEEKWIYRSYIAEYVDRKEYLERKCQVEYDAKNHAKEQAEQLNERLQKAFQEKEGLNERLQKAFQEKEGLNERLKKVFQEKERLNERLQKAFQEKEELKNRLQKALQNGEALNQRLQKAFLDKNELRSRLQTIEQEKEELKSNLGTAKLDLAELKEKLQFETEEKKKKEDRIQQLEAEIQQLRRHPAIRLETKLRSFRGKK